MSSKAAVAISAAVYFLTNSTLTAGVISITSDAKFVAVWKQNFSWMPVNYLIIESLQKFHHYYGDDFKVECPTGSGRYHTIEEVANELATRLTRLFLRNEEGQRPVFGDGASHQTGWTGLVAKLLQPRSREASADRDAETAVEISA